MPGQARGNALAIRVTALRRTAVRGPADPRATVGLVPARSEPPG